MTMQNTIRRILIVGDGIAGLTAALAVARSLRGQCNVTIIRASGATADPMLESGPGGLPSMRALHRSLGIDERDLLRSTNGTFKLATQFLGWTDSGSGYFQPFGDLGAAFGNVPFHQHWLRLAKVHDDISQFSLCATAARGGRFAHPSADPRSILSTLDYACHFDAGLHQEFLRARCRQEGIATIDCEVVKVEVHSNGDSIAALVLANDERIEADFYIDCSGASGVLIQGALRAGYEDWTSWLPCDRAVSITSQGDSHPSPCTQITRSSAGWQWRVPLQKSSSNGYVYSSQFLSDEAALQTLRSTVGAARGVPGLHRFTNGHRRRFWVGNCLALGTAAGFLEPLHATNLHLLHSGVAKLLALFPHRTAMQRSADEYNRLVTQEYERLRDLLVLCYHTSAPADAPLWKRYGSQRIPGTLEHKLEVFRSHGKVVLYDEETFDESYWIASLLGQRVRPEHSSALAEALPVDGVAQQLQRIKSAVEQAALSMPQHIDSLKKYCASTATGQKVPPT